MLWIPKIKTREELIYCVANSLDPRVVGEVAGEILDPRGNFEDRLDFFVQYGSNFS